MKTKVLFLVITMTAMMVASVGFTSCKNDEGGTEEVQPKSLEGTWICTNEGTKEIEVAMTFDKGSSVLVNLEGMWLFCNVERTATSMTLKGNQISMVSFKDFGNFTAKTMPFSVTVTYDYQQNGNTLIITNVKTTPALTVNLRNRYVLTFDKVYDGESFIL